MLNSNLNVYRTGWLDLVFENRNQSYGAYELRKNYDKTLGKALFTAIVLFVAVICSPVVYSKYFSKVEPERDPTFAKDTDDTVIVLDMAKVNPPPAKGNSEPVSPKAESQKADQKVVKYVPYKVAPESTVTDEAPTMTEIESAVVGSVNQEGASGTVNASASVGAPGAEGFSNGGPSTGDEVVPRELVERYPEFPGGMQAFAKYLQKNLRYPSLAVDNGIVGRVTVSFIVEKDGSLTDIKVIKGIGFGCDEEAVRVLKKSPQWSAGFQNHQKVRVQYTMPIVFQMN